MGQPDQGLGWYSKAFNLPQWIKLNSAMRTQLNYIEGMPTLIMFSMVSAIYYPLLANYCVWATLFGRLLYTIGYKVNPKMRVPGFLIVTIAAFTMMVTAFMSVHNLFKS